jgi:hypothetical protein
MIYKMRKATVRPREGPSLKEAMSDPENKQGHHSSSRNETKIDVIEEASPPSSLIHKASMLKPTKRPAKLRKAPSAPKRFTSSFIHFSAKKHKEIRAQLGRSASSERVSEIISFKHSFTYNSRSLLSHYSCPFTERQYIETCFGSLEKPYP